MNEIPFRSWRFYEAVKQHFECTSLEFIIHHKRSEWNNIVNQYTILRFCQDGWIKDFIKINTKKRYTTR